MGVRAQALFWDAEASGLAGRGTVRMGTFTLPPNAMLAITSTVGHVFFAVHAETQEEVWRYALQARHVLFSDTVSPIHK